MISEPSTLPHAAFTRNLIDAVNMCSRQDKQSVVITTTHEFLISHVSWYEGEQYTRPRRTGKTLHECFHSHFHHHFYHVMPSVEYTYVYRKIYVLDTVEFKMIDGKSYDWLPLSKKWNLNL